MKAKMDVFKEEKKDKVPFKDMKIRLDQMFGCCDS